MNMGDHFEALTASLSKLVGLHIKLARVEAVEDLKSLSRRGVVLMAVVPVAWAAFVLLTAALVLGLSRVMPIDLVLALVGGAYAVGATVGVLVVKKSMEVAAAPMNDSAIEVANTLAVVTTGRSGALSHG